MPSKLLLADDSVTIQRVIELTFEDEDIEVTTVGDGQQAIDRLERERPDIVLVDANMPERDGYEVAAYVKSTPALADIPVLLLTGAFEPVDEARARAARVDGVLSKPFETDTVIKRVRELLMGRRTPREDVRPSDEFGRAPLRSSFDDLAPLSPPVTAHAQATSGSIEDELFEGRDEAFGPPAASGGEPTTGEPDRAASAQWADGALRVGMPAEDPFAWDLPVDDVRTAAPASDPARTGPERVSPPAPPVAVARPVAPAVSLPAPPVEARPPLADAFAALLAAEQAQAAAAAVPAPSVEDTVGPIVERVMRRVIEQIDEQALREAVMEHVGGIAERLVRQELDRIKAGH